MDLVIFVVNFCVVSPKLGRKDSIMLLIQWTCGCTACQIKSSHKLFIHVRNQLHETNCLK
jgi:hypothetical protein